LFYFATKGIIKTISEMWKRNIDYKIVLYP
jgi:hypothetical protein